MSGAGTLVSLGLVFAQLSLLAFGGANAVLPEMQRLVVDTHHWLDPREFAAMFALAQAAPGPNMMVVSLIGWRVAGLSGALVSTVAVALPSSVLTYLVSGAWHRFRDASWRRALQVGLRPVTVGLITASAALLIRSTTIGWGTALVTLIGTVLFLATRLHPLLVLAAATALGAAGVFG
jgi:chromate transporter